MDLVLARSSKRPDGIFSQLLTSEEHEVCMTLEHSYDGEPKLGPGRYVCERGTHQLKSGHPFETFEITGVPGHSGMLFHPGNYNDDSKGCVLTGDAIAENAATHDEMLTNSRVAFARFMKLQEGVNEFWLTVI